MMVSAGLSVGTLAAQEPRILAPLDDYLLVVTREGARHSSLGDLAVLSLSSDDAELRVWGGYGHFATKGLVLRRRGGDWSAAQAELLECTIAVPIAVADTLSEAAEMRMRRSARTRCPKNEVAGTARLYSVYSAAEGPIATVGDLGELWSDLQQAGVDKLPVGATAPPMVLDGHTILVELRTAGEYRVTISECRSKGLKAADLTVAAIGRRLLRSIPSASWVRCGDAFRGGAG